MNMRIGDQPAVVGGAGVQRDPSGAGSPARPIGASGFAKQSLGFCLRHAGKIGATLLPLGVMMGTPVAAAGGILVGGGLLACKAISFFNAGKVLPANDTQITPIDEIETASLKLTDGREFSLAALLGMEGKLKDEHKRILTAFVSGAHIVFGNPPPKALVGPGGTGVVPDSAGGSDLTSHYTRRLGRRLDGTIKVGDTAKSTAKSTAILIGQTDDKRTYVQLEGHGTQNLWDSIGHGLDYITHVNHDYLQIGPMGSCPYSEKQGTQITIPR
ncbi:MAG: hypothetical protein LBU64_07360 [Planctomycetota bacterium]|jgi:hypothetical protein|nr:hypothetical protein [Planctomycetota bacterium]